MEKRINKKKESLYKTAKIKQKLCLILITFLAVLGGFAQTTSAETNAADEAEVVLHKIIFPENETIPSIDNEGKEVNVDTLMGGRPLAGVTFSLYDVTDYYYSLASEADHTSLVDVQNQIIQSLQTEGVTELGTFVDEATTDKEGLARFRISKKTQNGKESVYLFVENAAPEIVKHYAQPIVLMVPTIQSEIHLYPKNIEYVRDPYFFKHGMDETGKDLGALAGAEFRLYKIVEDTKYYLHEDKYDNGNTWIKEGEKGITTLISDEKGMVSTGDHHLPAGTYYFEEIKAPTGFQITEAARKIELIIPIDLKAQPTITIDGKLVSMNNAKIYNQKSPEVGKPSEPTSPNRSSNGTLPHTSANSSKKSFLPSTGDQTNDILIVIGLVIICCSVLIYQRKTGGVKE